MDVFKLHTATIQVKRPKRKKERRLLCCPRPGVRGRWCGGVGSPGRGCARLPVLTLSSPTA